MPHPTTPRRSSRALLPSLLTLGTCLATGGLLGCASSFGQTKTDAGLVRTVRVDYSNVHLLETSQGQLLIDAAGEHSAGEVLAKLHQEGLEPEKLRGLFLTHGHADHAGAAALLREELAVPVLAGAGDRRSCLAIASSSARLAMDPTSSPYPPDPSVGFTTSSGRWSST